MWLRTKRAHQARAAQAGSAQAGAGGRGAGGPGCRQPQQLDGHRRRDARRVPRPQRQELPPALVQPAGPQAAPRCVLRLGGRRDHQGARGAAPRRRRPAPAALPARRAPCRPMRRTAAALPQHFCQRGARPVGPSAFVRPPARMRAEVLTCASRQASMRAAACFLARRAARSTCMTSEPGLVSGDGGPGGQVHGNQVGQDRAAAARSHRQRDQEPLEQHAEAQVHQRRAGQRLRGRAHPAGLAARAPGAAAAAGAPPRTPAAGGKLPDAYAWHDMQGASAPCPPGIQSQAPLQECCSPSASGLVLPRALSSSGACSRARTSARATPRLMGHDALRQGEEPLPPAAAARPRHAPARSGAAKRKRSAGGSGRRPEQSPGQAQRECRPRALCPSLRSPRLNGAFSMCCAWRLLIMCCAGLCIWSNAVRMQVLCAASLGHSCW